MDPQQTGIDTITGIVGQTTCDQIMTALNQAGVRFEVSPDATFCESLGCPNVATMVDDVHNDVSNCDVFHYYCATHAPQTATQIQ